MSVKVLFFLTIFLLGLLSLHCGNAKNECPVPATSSLIYLHMEQLNALALQQNDHTQVNFPLICLKGHDEDCKEQKCCPDEIGCCLNERKEDQRHVRECGCKEATSKQCTFPPPLAVLAESVCDANGTTVITTCLMKKRVAQYLPNAGLETNQKYSPQDIINDAEKTAHYIKGTFIRKISTA